MTVDEKAAAFDLMFLAVTHQWWDGKWSWWCRTQFGPSRATREEALADFLEWAAKPINQK